VARRDFAKQTVLVRGSFTHGRPGPPKSGKVRSVPLIDQAARVLDALSRREHFTAPDELVFCTEVGDHLGDDGLRDRFYDALKAAGFGDRRVGANPMVFHDLRHTFGTLAVEAWPLHDVQAYMGHADIQTTMIYVHHQPKAAAADRLSDLVARATGADGAVSPTVSRNAEIGAQLSATGDTEAPANTGVAPV
jgi:integrase